VIKENRKNKGNSMNTIDKYSYYFYIVTDKNRISIETGTAGDLSIRLRELEEKVDSIADNEPKCLHLVYWESFSSVKEAMEREKEVKKWTDKKKKELLDIVNPGWQFLNEEINKVSGSLLL
jgi:putative endonuclease